MLAKDERVVGIASARFLNAISSPERFFSKNKLRTEPELIWKSCLPPKVKHHLIDRLHEEMKDTVIHLLEFQNHFLSLFFAELFCQENLHYSSKHLIESVSGEDWKVDKSKPLPNRRPV